VTATTPPQGLRAPLTPSRPGRSAVPRSALLPAAWPLAVYFVGYPLLWALGIANFAAPLLALPMAAWLVRQRAVRMPRGFGLWLLFLAWMLASALMLDARFGAYLAFAFRAASYASVTVFFLYVYNLPRGVTSARLADGLAALWVLVVALGLAALALPPNGFPSFIELVAPRGLLNNQFVFDLVHPRFAQVQVFLGYPVPRPAAPFVYTNNWGSSYALLLPLFLTRWLQGPSPVRRGLAKPLLAVSAIPVIVSLNRGLWLSIAVMALYAAARFARAGRVRALQAIVLMFALIAVLTVFTPLGSLVSDRLETGHSNESRLTLYTEVLARIGESPLLGFGGPQDTELINRNIPPVGTQGQFWMVLFSQGFIGAALFVAWLVLAFVRTVGVRTPAGFWCNIALLVALFQLPFYGMLPTQLHVVFVVAAIALRERAWAADGAGREVSGIAA
jgi:O-antigen ligase